MMRWLTYLSLLLHGFSCSDEELSPIPPTGRADGFVCDPQTLDVVDNARVSGRSPIGENSVLTDDNGYFLLDELNVGPVDLLVEGPNFSYVLPVTVMADETVRAQNANCQNQGTARLEGRVCAAESVGVETYYISGAAVRIDGPTIRETTTDADGRFVFENIPSGNYELTVRQGTFETQREVTVQADTQTDVGGVCVGPENRIAVVTGHFDAVSTILTGLGLSVSSCLPENLSACPATLDPNGTITLVDGLTPYYITDFMNDGVLLNSFDVVFFNCGLADAYLLSAPDSAKDNLRNFVLGGGSVYASDYAYEVVRVVFPITLDFFGNDLLPASAKVGLIDFNQTATVSHPALATALGSAEVELVFNKGQWVVLHNAQPAGVTPFLEGSVDVDTNGDTVPDATLDAPLLVSTPVGDGRLLFTSLHTHVQANATMTEILRYVVFEL